MTLQDRRALSVAFSKVIANFQQYFDKNAERKPNSYFCWCLIPGDWDQLHRYIFPSMIYDCLKAVGKSDRETQFTAFMMVRNFLIYNEKRITKAFRNADKWHLE